MTVARIFAFGMALAHTTMDIPHELRFSERFRIFLRRCWFGPRRGAGVHRVVRSRYYDTKFIVNLEDAIGYEIAINRFEWRELKLMLDACRRIRPEIFFDIGANLGVYSCVLAKHDAVPRIMAFEPDPSNRARLSTNLKLNGLIDRVEVHDTALG